MITMQEWKSMSGLEQTLWLERNTVLSGRSESLRGLVEGVGVNDATYHITPTIDGGKQLMCPAYMTWRDMLKRAYNHKYHVRQPTYSVVSVCDEWHSFSNFRSWWMHHHVDGYELDKDLLSDTRVYSPSTCIFVRKWLNIFTIGSAKSRGLHPIGTSYHSGKGRFIASCCNPITRKREHLGYFDTPEAAHLAWRARKLELALELKPRMDEIDHRIYPRVIEIINSAK